MALGLSLKDQEMMYAIQFPVLQQNEADTLYDTRGRIVFTRSQGLAGVGCGRNNANRSIEAKCHAISQVGGIFNCYNIVPYAHFHPSTDNVLFDKQPPKYYGLSSHSFVFY